MNSWSFLIMIIFKYINGAYRNPGNHGTKEGFYGPRTNVGNLVSNFRNCHEYNLALCIMKINQIFIKANTKTDAALYKELKALEATLLSEINKIPPAPGQDITNLINALEADIKKLIEAFQLDTIKQVTDTVIKNETDTQSFIDKFYLESESNIFAQLEKNAIVDHASNKCVPLDTAKKIVTTELILLKTKIDDEFKKLGVKQTTDIDNIIKLNVTKLLGEIEAKFKLLLEAIKPSTPGNGNTELKNLISTNIRKTIITLERTLTDIINQTRSQIFNLYSCS